MRCLPILSKLFSTCAQWSPNLFNLSPSCLPDVFPVWFPRCCFPVACKVSPLLSSCRPLVSQQWFPSCLPDVVSQFSLNCFPGHDSVLALFPSCLTEFVFQYPQISSTCQPILSQLSPSYFSDVVSYLSSVVSRLSCRCGLSIVSQLSPRLFRCGLGCLSLSPSNAQLSPRCAPNNTPLPSTWSPNCVP